MKPHNPLNAIFTVRKSELPLTLMMFSYFFLVITSFWILKPLKKALFIEFYDQQGFSLFAWHMTAAQAELLAKVLNMVVAFVAVAIFTWLARRFRRQQLTFIFTGFFLLSYILYSLIIAHPDPLTAWSFYLFGDLLSTLMVATFFAFLNDSVTPEAAKRLYGPIGLGGVVGGVIGTTFVRGLIDDISLSGWLWICVVLSLLILVVAYAAGRLVDRDPSLAPPANPLSTVSDDVTRATRRNPALEGAQLVLHSPYLFSIVGIVGLYEIVSTIMDFQFTSTIAHYLDGPAIGRQLSTVFAITNVVSLCVQLFLTSWIMTRFGIMTALLVLPLVTLAGSGAFMAVPALWVGSLLNTVDNGFSYSINQSAKEALYVPTTPDEKYKAKAFIDMFVQRFAKAIAVVISLGITVMFKDFTSLRWLSGCTMVIIVIWIAAARYAGKRFQRLEAAVERVS